LTTHLIIPDQHAHYQHSNERADWLAQLIIDIKPDVVINIGDSADMPSLSGYDKGKRGFHGRTYRQDIDAHLDFQDRLWAPVVQRKKRLPRSIFCIGNHEWRIERALDLSPELQGSIGLGDLDLGRWYDQVVPYNGGTPGVINVDGILYAHYFISGVMGRPVGGEHPAYSLLQKHYKSATSGHLHLADQCIRTDGDGRKVMGTFCGCYQDYDADWAGEANRLWWRGVLVKNNVDNGTYDPEWISIDSLRKAYGRVS
jgi:hypothetical protein